MNKKKPVIWSILFLFTSAYLQAQEQPELNIGGAVRFNYNYSTWKQEQARRGGDFGFDVFRLDVKAGYKGIDLDAEYRLYSNSFGGGMLKQGALGYAFNNKDKLQIGLVPVPFGNSPINSNSFFFSLNYYLGLEDNYDMGARFTHVGDKMEYSLAFLKNAEELDFGDNSDLSPSRYAYDVGSIDLHGDGNLSFRNKKVNQLNGKIDFKFGENAVRHKIGVSAQFGGLYNLDTKNTGTHYATAAHYNLEYRKLEMKAQYTRYAYNPKAPNSESKDVVALAAYGGAYLVAAQANTYTLGLSYKIPVSWKPISELSVYNDYGYMHKPAAGFKSSQMNVTGVMVSAGKVVTYIDVAAGKNQPWLGPEWNNALAQGGEQQDKWHVRCNMNIGYYF
ncbi:hypothetical protein ACL9RF_02615 [Sphingobacterium sp. Mn56C]|uniref:hypothetical protein n=1 Tax=Sphingobacterium sp. Mn56C TaxID=3395261 RepID=UPI003BC69061